MIKILYITWSLLFSCTNPPDSPLVLADRQILDTFWTYAGQHRLETLPVAERIPWIASFFIGTPYQSHTLDQGPEESLVINLHELDCVTFVENVLALAFLKSYTPEAISDFIRQLTRIRYRNARITDYSSRLHYSTDWLYEMQQIHLLHDPTASAGGIPHRKQVHFMSEHSDLYPRLQQRPDLVEKIKEIETAINQRTYHYIPKEQINQASGQIQSGDILLITTHTKGLDTSHLGFAWKEKGKIYLLHASSTEKKVCISKQPLQEYMQGIRSQSGIIIARVVQK